jgi:hypothetical protein
MKSHGLLPYQTQKTHQEIPKKNRPAHCKCSWIFQARCRWPLDTVPMGQVPGPGPTRSERSQALEGQKPPKMGMKPAKIQIYPLVN